jgi:hypothetical protein
MSAVERILDEPASAAVAADAILPAARRRAVSPRRVFAAVAAGSVVLALLASSDLPSWGEELGPGVLTPSLRRAANLWNGEMERLGLTRPHEALRAGMRWLRDRQWP